MAGLPGNHLPSPGPDDCSRFDNDDHHRAEDVRPRLYVDRERVVRHAGHRQRDVQPVLQIQQRWPRCDPRRGAAAHHHPGDAVQHPALQDPGGNSMTSTSAAAASDAAAQAKGGFRPRRLRFPVHLTLGALLLIWLLPTIGVFVNSFRRADAINTGGWWTIFTNTGALTVDNYSQVIGQEDLGSKFRNSLYITIPATVIPTMIAAFSAYAFAWMRFPGKNVLSLLLVALIAV